MKKGARGKHVVSHAQDLKTKILHRLQSKCQRGNECKERSSVFKRCAKSNLQNRVPNANRLLDRDPRSCAEHQAVHKLLDDRPSAKSSEIRTCTVIGDAKTGEAQALKHCGNCMNLETLWGLCLLMK